MKKFSKILMIFCVLFSQLSGAITVFADETQNQTNSNEGTPKIEESTNDITVDDSLTESNIENNNIEDSTKDSLGDQITDTTTSNENDAEVEVTPTQGEISGFEDETPNPESETTESGEGQGDNAELGTETKTVDILANDETTYIVGENESISFKLDTSGVSGVNSVMINGTEKISEFTQEGNIYTYSVDYTNAESGTYIYKLEITFSDNSSVTKIIYVNYNSDTVIFKGNDEGVTAYIKDTISASNLTSAIKMPVYTIEVIDQNNTEVTTGNVTSDMTLKISKDNEEVLNANISLLNEMSDIVEITKVIDALQNGWNKTPTIDNTNKISTGIDSSITEEVQLGDTFTVRFYLENFNSNKIQGLSGKIEYDKTTLKLKNYKIMPNDTSMTGTFDENTGEFIIYGNDYNTEKGTLIEFEFTAIGAATEAFIAFSDLSLAYAGQTVSIDQNRIDTSVEVTYTNNKGGDEDTNTNNENKVVNLTNKIKSSDSYLSILTIEGVDFEFSPYTFNYEITVGSDVDSLDLTAILSDNNASYVVYGNEDFQEGENIVTIVVTAEDGSTHTYTIVVNKEKEEKTTEEKEDTEEKESNVSRTIIIILIILVIIGLIYLIFKDDEEDKDNTVKNNVDKEKKDKNK